MSVGCTISKERRLAANRTRHRAPEDEPVKRSSQWWCAVLFITFYALLVYVSLHRDAQMLCIRGDLT